MLISPTSKSDCDMLHYCEGLYYVKDDADEKFKLRFEKTAKSAYTQINSDDLRKIRLNVFTSPVKMFLNNIRLKKDNNSDVEELKKFLESSGFKLLFRDVLLPEFKEDYPDFPYTAEDFGVK